MTRTLRAASGRRLAPLLLIALPFLLLATRSAAPPAYAAPPAQDPPVDLCTLLPPNTENDESDAAAGGGCMRFYRCVAGQDATNCHEKVTVLSKLSPQDALDWLHGTASGNTSRIAAPYGDEADEFHNDVPAWNAYGSRFVRGCYAASGITDDPGRAQWIHEVLAELDKKLQQLPCPGATPTPGPASSPPDLAVDHIEVVQVVQDEYNRVPLVADKPTVVRVFPKVASPPGTQVNGVSARLTIELAAGEEITVEPNNGPISAVEIPDRESIDGSLNFYLPRRAYQGGSYVMHVELNPDRTVPESNYDNNQLTHQLVYSVMPHLRVAYLRVGYQPPGQASPTWASNAIAGYAALARQLYPLGESETHDSYLEYYQVSAQPVWRHTLQTSADGARLIAALRRSYLMSSGRKTAGQLIAWLPNINGFVTAGKSDPLWGSGAGRVTFGQDATNPDPLDMQHTLAHEMAHNFGLRHPCKSKTNCDACNAVDPGTNWPYTTSGTQELGFDVARGALVPGYNHKDLISYCWREVWISPFSYTTLQTAIASLPARAGQAQPSRLDAGLPGLPLGALLPASAGAGVAVSGAAAPAREQAVISGWLKRDGSGGEITSVFRSADFPANDTFSEAGATCLRLDGAAGPAQHCFDLEWVDHRTQEPLAEQYFAVNVPWADGVSQVELVHSSRVLSTVPAGGQGPSVSISEPQRGAKWASGAGTVRWSATDAEGKKLSYAVLYSDDGESWFPVDVDIDSGAQELAIADGQLAGGSNSYFRVLASNGLNTSQAQVGPFSLPVRPPLSPAGGQTAGSTGGSSGSGGAAGGSPAATGGTAAAGSGSSSGAGCLGVGMCGSLLVAGGALGIVLKRRRGKAGRGSSRPTKPSAGTQAAPVSGSATPDPRAAAPAPGAAARSRFCRNCGTALAPGAHFCSNCGQPTPNS